MTDPLDIIGLVGLVLGCGIGAVAVWALLVRPLGEFMWFIGYQICVKLDGHHPDDIDRHGG